MPLRWEDVPTAEAEDFTLATVPALYAERGDPGAGIDEAAGSLEALLELSARDEAEGLGDAPWPPTYRKSPGEPPRVQPSKQRRPDADYDTPRGRGRTREEPTRRSSGSPGPGHAARRHPTAPRAGPRRSRSSRSHGRPGRTKPWPASSAGRRAARTAAAAPRTGRRPGGLDAWTIDDLDPGPGQPASRRRGRPAAAGAARPRLRPDGPSIRRPDRAARLERTLRPSRSARQRHRSPPSQRLPEARESDGRAPRRRCLADDLDPST